MHKMKPEGAAPHGGEVSIATLVHASLYRHQMEACAFALDAFGLEVKKDTQGALLIVDERRALNPEGGDAECQKPKPAPVESLF